MYNLKATFKFISILLDVEFLPKKNTLTAQLASDYLPGLWNLLVNLLNYLIMDKISRLLVTRGLWRNYTEYLSKEKFIMRISFVYVLINTLFVPMLSLTLGESLLNLLLRILEFRSFSRAFILTDTCTIL